jgi:peroxiredoxin
MVRRIPPRAAALVAVGALLAGCGSEQVSAGDRVDAGAQGVSEQGYVSGDGTITIVPAADRTPAPALSGPTLEGGQFSLADHLGEVVVMNVWASWCAPCRAEAEDLQAVWAQVEGDGVQFVGLNTRDSPAAATAFVDRFGITYPNVVDKDATLQLLFHESLPPAAIPSTLVIDAQGRVAARAIGPVDRSQLLGLIEPLQATSASGTGVSDGGAGSGVGS